jgi:hypothetical protein
MEIDVDGRRAASPSRLAVVTIQACRRSGSRSVARCWVRRSKTVWKTSAAECSSSPMRVTMA